MSRGFKRPAKIKRGMCKLTGLPGRFVKAHIQPRAVTQPREPGLPWIEGGKGTRPKRVHSSWYDPELVTMSGEKILTSYDTWGITELRRLKLLWSSWKTDSIVGFDDWNSWPPHEGYGLRKLICNNPTRLRLFFLSILWRAAASALPACDEVQMDASELNTLTAMVRDGDPGPLSFYPATLLQLAHRGTVHNFSPLAEDIMQDLGNGEKKGRYLFRFYFDGLVIMMHRPRSNEPIPDHGTMTVGASSTLIVLTIPTAGSLEMRNIAKIHKEAIEQWPDTMSRLDPLAWMRKELGDG